MKLDYSPEGYVFMEGMNGSNIHLHCLGLFDADSTTTLINRHAIPKEIQPKTGHPQEFTTIQGTYISDGVLQVEQISFPQFCKTCRIMNLIVCLFDSPASRYNIILGCDILSYGFVMDKNNRVTWDGLSISMVSPTNQTDRCTSPSDVCTHYQCAFAAHATHAAATCTILEAKYEPVSPDDVISKCSHLNPPHNLMLKTLLTKYQSLFSGKLGKYKR